MKRIGILLAIILSGWFAGAQDVPLVTVYHTDNFGRYFQNYPVPEGTIFKVHKTSSDELRKLLEEKTLRLAVSGEPMRGPGLKCSKIAFKAVILAVHPANKLRNLSTKQAREILEKKHGSWRALGGPSARIHLYLKAKPELPPPVMRTGHTHDRTRPKTILDLPPLGGQTQKDQPVPTVNYAHPLKIQTENDARSFSMLCTDPFGLAGFDITRYDENRVPLLTIDQIPPTLDNFRAGSYPLLQTYYLIEPESPTAAEKEVIRFIRSGKFAAMLYRNGLLPVLPKKIR